jgi:hypothetical protein
MWNTFNFGNTNTTAPDQFKVNVGVYNPLLGKGYGEMAAESRSNHKTQGFGSARQRGDAFEYFKTLLGDAPKDDLMDGVTTTWNRIPGGNTIGPEVAAITKSFNSDAPQASVPALVNLLGKVDQAFESDKAMMTVRLIPAVVDEYRFWHKQKTKELSDLIAACAGLWFESYAQEPIYSIGDSIATITQIYTPNNTLINGITIYPGGRQELHSIAYDGYVLQKNELKTYTLDDAYLKLPLKKITQPYWLSDPHGIGSYSLINDTLAGNPENSDKPKVKFKFSIEGKPIHFERELVYKHTDPARGEIYQPLIVAPPVTANIQNKVYIFNSQQPQTVQVKLKSFKNGATGNIRLNAPAGFKISPESIPFNNKAKGDEWEQDFTLTPSGNQSQTGVLEAQVTLGLGPKVYNYSILSIHYNHIPDITIFPPAQAKLLQLDLKIAGKRIGYINGAGDLVQDALRQVGYEVHTLSEGEILNGDLSGYDAIVVGVRAYNVDPRLAIEQPKLLEYVKNGGNLLVQYNNNNGLVTKQIGPYPFKVVNERVTDENAKITIIDPNNPVLNYPNKISQSDFDGWVQERGLYFTKDADGQYQKVLQMNDPGEGPKDGALITTQYGKGRFIYTSLAFFRQLPAGVPGAYRLFINMLNKPKTNP